MKAIDTAIPDVKLLEPRVFGDDRGFFMESWNARTFAGLGIDVPFVQDNHSRSAGNVVRGLHYQLAVPQGKLVRVVAGAIFDVAVDLRVSSPTYGKWVSAILSAENKHQLWIPEGFGHGFLSLADGTEVIYKCTDFYDAASERSVLWNDPDIAIDWPLAVGVEPLVSGKDAAGLSFKDAEKFA